MSSTFFWNGNNSCQEICKRESFIASTNKKSANYDADKSAGHAELQSGSAASQEFVESYLLYLLAAASEKASAQFHEKVRDSGLRVPEWRVLAILADRDGAMITRLADVALIEQSRLTRIIDQMDKRNLVKRKSDANDGRRVRIFLTAKGRRLAQSLINDARIHEQDLLESLPDANAEQLKPLLSALLLRLQKG